jgi:hypothetical protein
METNSTMLQGAETNPARAHPGSTFLLRSGAIAARGLHAKLALVLGARPCGLPTLQRRLLPMLSCLAISSRTQSRLPGMALEPQSHSAKKILS